MRLEGPPPSSSRLVAAAPQFDPRLLTLAFVFLLIGYGTKIGLVPMHAWLRSPPSVVSRVTVAVARLRAAGALRLNVSLVGSLLIIQFVSFKCDGSFPRIKREEIVAGIGPAASTARPWKPHMTGGQVGTRAQLELYPFSVPQTPPVGWLVPMLFDVGGCAEIRSDRLEETQE